MLPFLLGQKQHSKGLYSSVYRGREKSVEHIPRYQALMVVILGGILQKRWYKPLIYICREKILIQIFFNSCFLKSITFGNKEGKEGRNEGKFLKEK